MRDTSDAVIAACIWLLALFLVIMILALLVGCATPAQQQYADALRARSQPLLTLEQYPGGGIKTLIVGQPAAGQVMAPPRNEWAGVVQAGVGVLGTVLGIREGGRATADLVDAVGGVVGGALGAMPDPVVVNQPAPVVVPPADPVIVPPVAPIIVEQPDPIIVEQPDPIIVRPEIVSPGV